MIRILFIILGLLSFLKANPQIVENENIFILKLENKNFDEVLLNIKNEILFRGFNIVYELNLAKSTTEVANFLDKKAILEKGTNLGLCKSSFTFEMVEEDFHNINFCPLGISIYKNFEDNVVYISYKKYKPLMEKNEKIAFKINEELRNLILKSLD